MSPTKGSPVDVKVTVSSVKRRLQRAQTWASEALVSPADHSTSRGQLSPETPLAVTTNGPFHLLDDVCDQQTRIPAGLHWKRGGKIGSGSYGSVYKALDMETGFIFAVKQAVLEEGNEDDNRYHEKLRQELEIYKELRHPHVVSYLGHDYADSHLYIYLAFVPGGSLASFLSEFGPIHGPMLRTGSRGMAEGLGYLHTRTPPIVHRDVKGANVLVDLNFCLKLADFGCSKRDFHTKSFTTMGSIPWMAPEVIQQQDGFGRKADVWSLGCTIIEMATADKPWGRHTFDNMMFALRHIALSGTTPPIPDGLPPGGEEFLGACLRLAPDERPTATELLGDEFIRDWPGIQGGFSLRRGRNQ